MKTKLKRFSEINAFSNVIQPEIRYPESDADIKGHWNSSFFMNDGPIVLEIGCGKGEYSLALAKRHPECNIIGIDIKGDRIWKGAKAAMQLGLDNLAFLRIQAERLPWFFAPAEVADIWITFPDPQLRESRSKKRLTSPQFLKRYAAILKDNGKLRLKTDSERLYDYTLETISESGHVIHFKTTNLYQESPPPDPLILEIKTHYESMFLKQGKPIFYLEFSLNRGENKQ